MDLRLAMMCGTDIPVPECQLTIHQPRIKEIAMIGESDFFVGAQCLSLHKSMFSQGKEDLDTMNNFQIFMTIMSEKDTVDKKQAVLQVLTLLFPNYKVLVTPQSLLFREEGKGNVMIDQNNFEYLQEKLRLVFCASTGPMDQQAFNPADARAKEIADKLMQGRQRVAEEKGETNVSIFSQYLSILTIGLSSMSLKDLMDLTMFQLYDLVERYSLFVNWDIDIKSRLAGAKPDSSPENWMKNIHNK